MVQAPKVSVVLPVYNGGAYLRAAVRSILDQTLDALELVLIDDHSTDGAIAALGLHDPRLRVVANKGRGIVAALNSGLQQARGEFIARMDADDLSLSNRIQTQWQFMQENPAIGIAGARVEIFSAQGLAGGQQRYQAWINELNLPGEIRRDMFVECPLPHPTLFMRRETMMGLGGYRDVSWPEDYDLLLRAEQAGILMGKPPEVLLRWRDHDSRLSRNAARYSQKEFLKAKLEFLDTSRLHGRPVIIWGAGVTGKALCDGLLQQGIPVRAFLEVHPRRINGFARGIPVLHFSEIGQFTEEVALIAVGVPSARLEIREFMLQAGKVEGDDFLFLA